MLRYNILQTQKRFFIKLHSRTEKVKDDTLLIYLSISSKYYQWFNVTCNVRVHNIISLYI